MSTDRQAEDRRTLARLRARIADASPWPVRATVVFPNHGVGPTVVRALAEALTGRALAAEPSIVDGWARVHALGGEDAVLTDLECWNYGLGFTIERAALYLAGVACVRTEEREDDNCAPPAEVAFEVGAASPEALERVRAALHAWHRARAAGAATHDA